MNDRGSRIARRRLPHRACGNRDRHARFNAASTSAQAIAAQSRLRLQRTSWRSAAALRHHADPQVQYRMAHLVGDLAGDVRRTGRRCCSDWASSPAIGSCKSARIATNGFSWIWRCIWSRGVHVAVHATLAGPQIAVANSRLRRPAGVRLRRRTGRQSWRRSTATFDGLQVVSFDPIDNLSDAPPIQRLIDLLADVAGDDPAAIALQSRGRRRNHARLIWRRFSTPPARPASRKA